MSVPKDLKSLFGRFSPPLLKAYLVKHHQIELPLDVDALPRKRFGPVIYDAWLKVPTHDRQAAEAELYSISQLATEKGVLCTIQTAAAFQRPIHQELQGYDGFESRLLHVACHHPDLWLAVRQYVEIENLVDTRWFHFYPGFPKRPIENVEPKRILLANEVGKFFDERDGRGKIRDCEYQLVGTDTEYFFLKLDSHSSRQLVVDDRGRFDDASIRPGFEVVFVHHRSTGDLNLFAEGGRQVTDPLRCHFSLIMHGVNPPELREQVVPYDLNRFLDSIAELAVDPNDHIERAILRRLWVRSVGEPEWEFMVRGSRDNPHRGVYAAVAGHWKHPLDREHYDVVRAMITLQFRRGGPIPKRAATFQIGSPRSDTFRRELIVVQNVIRKCLREWKIDVTAASSATDLTVGTA